MGAEIFLALIALASTVISALVGLYGAKKLNIGPNQERLVTTLKDVVAAQNLRIVQLEQSDKAKSEEISALRKEIADLRTLTIDQARTISQLRQKGVM